MLNKERVLRKKAEVAGFSVRKGFCHYLYNGAVMKDQFGNREIGYSVMNMSTGFYVWGCYNANFDNLWSLEDVENFLRDQYIKSGLVW